MQIDADISTRVAEHRTGLVVDTRDLSELAGGYKQDCRWLVPFLGLDDNEQVEREGCRSLEFVRRCFVGPHVGVRKAGLVSTSACTPLGAVLFCGVVSAGNPNDCHDDSDACPLGRCSVDTGYHRASSETVYLRPSSSQRN